MEIKLGNSNLRTWQNGYDWGTHQYEHRDIPMHTRVCSASNRKWLGIIVNMDPRQERKMYGNQQSLMEVKTVDVFWQTGPNRGKTQKKNVEDLVNYDSYKARIYAELKELEDNEAEAKKAGL